MPENLVNVELAYTRGEIILYLPGTASSDHNVPVGWPQRRMNELLQFGASFSDAFKQLVQEWCGLIGLDKQTP